MIVLAIIALLVVMAIPGMQRARENVQNARFASDVRVATSAFITFATETGKYPPDTQPAQMPNGMADYLKRMHWSDSTSLGGSWDWDYKQFGVTAGVSVFTPRATPEQMERLDKLVDDGNVSTGYYRNRSSGYICVIEP